MLRATPIVCLAATLLLAAAGSPVLALITGGEGNAPIDDPGWPRGAATVFNHAARIAWWEGPPFGGGQWHGEFRGDAHAFNLALANFAKVDAKVKRLVVHDGVGHSFWLNPNGEAEKEQAARVDWVFVVWLPNNWERLREMPPDLRPGGINEADSPPAIIDAYTGGLVNWADVVVPEGVEVIDDRLEAHGFDLRDGPVLEGGVVELGNERPMAAQVELQRVEPQEGGGYRYPAVATTATDAKGHWVIKKAPAGSFRVVVSAEGFVPRIAAHVSLDGEPRWQELTCGLSRPGPVTGLVADEFARPIGDVEVRLGDVAGVNGKSYSTPDELSATTGDDGRFRIDGAPTGSARIWLHKPGYCVDGLGRETAAPGSVALMMKRAAQLRVTVDFSKMQRPEEYIVEIEPKGGSKVGSWGGSATIDADNQTRFSDVPPGRYVLRGKPNPTREDEITKARLVELRGGEEIEVTLDPMERE